MEQEKRNKTLSVPLWDNQLTHNLLIAFIVLKLHGDIDWSWFWVLSPKLFQIGLVFIISLWNEWKSFTSKL